MASQTLNQVVKTISGIGQSHQQIKTVYFGNLLDFLSKGTDNVYPAMFFDLTGSSIANKTLTMDFSLYFMDRMLPEQTNETEVLSDQLSVAQDIIAMLMYQDFDFVMSDSVQLAYFTENTPDLLAGVRADIRLELPFTADRCWIPTSYNYPN